MASFSIRLNHQITPKTRGELKNLSSKVINSTKLIHIMQVLSSPSIAGCVEYLIYGRSSIELIKTKQGGAGRRKLTRKNV